MEFLDQEWESLSKMFSFEDSDFQSSSNNMLSNHGEFSISPSFFGGDDDDQSLFFTSDHNNSNTLVDHHASFYCASQESSNSTGETETAALFSNAVDFLDHDGYSMDFCNMVPAVFSDHHNVMEEIVQLRAEICSIDQLSNAALTQPGEAEDSCKEMQVKRKQSCDQDHNQSPKKKPRVSKNNAPKNKRNTQAKKNKKATNNDEEVENMNEQSSSICSSEEGDSNASQQELTNGGSTSESKGKGKAGNKGPATDPQSLYARKRRERINERLKILQNLVPNGTKVDISTMLEEAVHYVKFLQLQIKLLSSDDLWMYAPIAYNGMDMGLYQKIVPNLWSN